MKVNSSQGLPTPASLCIKVGKGQHAHTYRRQSTENSAPEPLTVTGWYWLTIGNQSHALCVHCSETLPRHRIPTLQGGLVLAPFAELEKLFKHLERGGGNIRALLKNKTKTNHPEL